MRTLCVGTTFIFALVSTADDKKVDPPALKVGDPVPEFTLQGSDGKTYKSVDLKGKTAYVIAWYPKASTRGCTVECKSLAEAHAALKKLNVAVFGASVDPVDANKKFAEEVSAKYPLLSDTDKSVAKAFGVLGPKGMAQRWTFFIDKEGIVRHIEKNVKVQSHGKDVGDKAKELGFDK
jgi:thioredoxin-dependent peroxiredoxin